MGAYEDWMNGPGIPQEVSDRAIGSFSTSVGGPEAALEEIRIVAKGIAEILSGEHTSLGAVAIALGLLAKINEVQDGRKDLQKDLNGFLSFVAAGYALPVEKIAELAKASTGNAVSPLN